MAKKANTRSDAVSHEEIKNQDEALKAERRAEQNQTQRELANAGSQSAEQAETVRQARSDLRAASLETEERAHAVTSLGYEEERGQRPELPISDSNPPSDQSIHELTTTDLHPSVTTPQGTQADTIGDAHELRDINFRALIGWFVGLFALIAISMGLMALMFNILVNSQKYKEEWPSPLLAEVQPEPPARPLLPNPELPLQEYNQNQHEFMSEYSRDPKTGRVRIPIERAMTLTAQRGLPTTLKADSGRAVSGRTQPLSSVVPGQAEVKEPLQSWRNPAYFIPPSHLGVGENDPNFAYRVPREGYSFPSAQLRDVDGVGGKPDAKESTQGH
jgi:hypothetical protein